ncbi:Septin-7 [Echinococcus granulosus]|uniref:Septin-7 n=1 Tax=Echinococcus granulosus TaxID=6210 RepID=W6UPL7_ECHGR|nr:Septin-7 [Echinococcus granulosus]EUB60217.1 Septin-7 [Echinococcus granulosus]
MSRVITNVTSSSPNSRMVSKDHIRSSSSEASIDKSEPSISFKSKLFANDSSEKENTSNRDSLHNISGKAPVQPKNIFDVGFSKLPKQIYRKTIKRGFTFNIMLVGVAGLGKSTFLNTLFMTDIYNDEFLAPSVRFYKDASAAASVASHTFNLTEQGVALRLTVIDAPGYGEALDNSSCWRLLVEEINRRNAAFMEAESRVQRNTTGSGCGGSGGRLGVTPEDLIHACFYFLSPTGHGVRQMDLEAMRALHDKTKHLRLRFTWYSSVERLLQQASGPGNHLAGSSVLIHISQLKIPYLKIYPCENVVPNLKLWRLSALPASVVFSFVVLKVMTIDIF